MRFVQIRTLHKVREGGSAVHNDRGRPGQGRERSSAEVRTSGEVLERDGTKPISLARRNGAQGRNRTTDTMIFSHVLYQLSYLGARIGRRGPAARQAVL